MNDELIDRTVRATSPLDAGSLATLDFEMADLELLEAILDGSFGSELDDADDDVVTSITPLASRRTRWRRMLVPAAVAACIALIVGIVIGVIDDRTQYAEAAVLVAKSNERLLIDDPAWKVTKVNQFTEDNGEMVFGDGTHEVSLNWYPAVDYDVFLADRSEAGELGATTLLGQAATIVEATGADTFYLLLAPNSVNFLEIRANEAGGRSAFLELMAKFHQVGIEDWLDALPSTTITAAARPDAIDAMLADVKLPPGFDTSGLAGTVDVSDPYQLGATVVSSVMCGWFDVYFDAQSVGDEGRMAEAAAALGESHEWKVLQDMSAQGAFPQVVFDTVDPVQPGGSGVMKAGNPVARETVAGAFGCGW